MVTNDTYIDASLVVAKALRDLYTNHELAVLISPDDVSEKSIQRLKCLYDTVLPVAPISGFLSEPLLNWQARSSRNIYQTAALVTNAVLAYTYLDADTLPLQNLNHLFAALASSTVSFAAAPEVGYPDTFNSGVCIPRLGIRP